MLPTLLTMAGSHQMPFLGLVVGLVVKLCMTGSMAKPYLPLSEIGYQSHPVRSYARSRFLISCLVFLYPQITLNKGSWGPLREKSQCLYEPAVSRILWETWTIKPVEKQYKFMVQIHP